MSDFYQKFRSEIAAGGAVGESNEPTMSGRLTGVVMVLLLGWLAVANTWAFVFAMGLIVSVFLHEVGHFTTAKWTGMKSTQFFMGFGPRVWSRRRGEVEYGVRALPVGAFVRIIGMNDLDEVDPEDEARAYRSKSYPRKMLVITAGSIMHMIIAFALFAGVYMTAGREQNTGRSTVREIVTGESAAWSAGLRLGDEIVSIDGVEVGTYESLVDAVTMHRPGDSVEIVYRRGDDTRSTDAVLQAHPNGSGRAYLGVAADDWENERLGPLSAVSGAVAEIGRTAVSSVRGVVVALNPVNSLRHLTNADEPIDTRPTTIVGVTQVSGDIGNSDGLSGVLVLLALVNVFVGVFNLFPLLPFDGGHAAIATYERIRSRRGRRYTADVSKMVPVATAVVGLLVVLLMTGLYLDITRPLG